MFRVCMSVCYDIQDGLLAGSYVCTHGAILRIRLAEVYQLVENKQSREQQVWCVLNEYFRLWTEGNIGPDSLNHLPTISFLYLCQKM